MTYDVVALGELLIDFTSSGASPQGNPVFEANPGGAPCNVLAMLAKLGKKTAFIGKVGDDMFGHQLLDTLDRVGIETAGVRCDPSVNTTLAFVKNAPDGDREFSFFRKPGADTMLRPDEVDLALVQSCRVFHFGTLSLTDQPARDATYAAVQAAQAAGAILSFDPNLRPLLWDDLAEARRQMEWGLARCDILKIADSELTFLAECADFDGGCQSLLAKYPNIRLLLLTLGKQGCRGYMGGLTAARPTFLQVRAVDTTGAGDTFLGSCLYHVLEGGLDSLADEARLADMLTFANAAATLVSARKGAIMAMPDRQDVEDLINNA